MLHSSTAPQLHWDAWRVEVRRSPQHHRYYRELDPMWRNVEYKYFNLSLVHFQENNHSMSNYLTSKMQLWQGLRPGVRFRFLGKIIESFFTSLSVNILYKPDLLNRSASVRIEKGPSSQGSLLSHISSFPAVVREGLPLLVWRKASQGEPIAVLYLVVPHVPHSVRWEKLLLEFPQWAQRQLRSLHCWLHWFWSEVSLLWNSPYLPPSLLSYLWGTKRILLRSRLVFLWDLWLPYFFIHLAYLSTASRYMSSPLTLCTVACRRVRHSKISTDHILTSRMFQKNWELSDLTDGLLLRRTLTTRQTFLQDCNFVIL